MEKDSNSGLLGRLGLGRRGEGAVPVEGRLACFRDRIHTWFACNCPQVSILAMTDPSHTVLKVDRQELLVDFGGLFAWYKRSPQALDRVLEEFIQEVVQELGNRTVPLFEDVIDRIYPQVRHFAFLQENSPRFGKGRLVRLALGGELNLLFVMDEGRGMTFVNEGHLEAWGVGSQAMENLALRNLHRRHLPLRRRRRHYDPGGYAASHLVILDRLLRLAPEEEVLVAVPDRDSIYIQDRDMDPRDAEALALEVQRLWRNATRPVSPDLFRCKALSGGGIKVSPTQRMVLT